MKSNFLTQVEGDYLPELSVILPVYNGEKYLDTALNSILGQSFVNFELIIIDDGSTDGSLSILKKFKDLDKRIRLVSRENKNLAATLNESIDLARGDWIARMDQDDIALNQRFEIQLNWLKITNADICGSWVQVFGGEDTRVLRFPVAHSAISLDLLFKNPLVHPAVIMRAHLARALKYDQDFEGAEDYDFWVRACLYGANFTNIPKVLLRYRHHSSQISSASKVKQAFVSDSIRRKYWHQLLSKNNINNLGASETLEALCIDHKSELNFNEISKFLNNLLIKCGGEEHSVALLNIQSLYLNYCIENPSLFWRIWELRYGMGLHVTSNIFIKMILVKILSTLRARKVLIVLKNLHNRL